MSDKNQNQPATFDYGDAFASHNPAPEVIATAAAKATPKKPHPLAAVVGIVAASAVFLSLFGPIALFFYYRWQVKLYTRPAERAKFNKVFFGAVVACFAIMAVLVMQNMPK